MNKKTALSAIALFDKLPAYVKTRIGAHSAIQPFRRNGILFREGESADFVHGIISGQVALFVTVAGEETVIGFFGPGETLLIPPALLNLPYMLSAKATTDGVALLLPAEEFRKLVEQEGVLAAACAKLLSSHWRVLVSHMKQIKTQDARSRLVQYLLDNADKSSGRTSVTLPGRKKQLATHLGVAPETLSRMLHGLKSHGVEVTGPNISIRSLAALRKLAGTDQQTMTKI